MSETPRYVQHQSGQGAKWEVLDHIEVPQPTAFHARPDREWYVRAQSSNPTGLAFHVLPKSEYILCAPPEEWRDVTAECEWDDQLELLHRHGIPGEVQVVSAANGYRLRKVELCELHSGGPPSFTSGFVRKWAFLIEQRVTG